MHAFVEALTTMSSSILSIRISSPEMQEMRHCVCELNCVFFMGFYSFACGNFVKETTIPDEKVSVNTFSVIGDKLQEQLRSLISEEINPRDSEPFNLAKRLYRACMNKTLIEERGLKPLTSITDKLGGWPVVLGDKWDPKSEWSWTWAVKEFRKVGYSMDYIFDFSIGIDLKKSTSRIIDVSFIKIWIFSTKLAYEVRVIQNR